MPYLKLNHYKKPKSFTRKKVTWQKNQKTTLKKLFPFFIFKIVVVTLFITLNLLSSSNFISEDDSIFYQNNPIENNKNHIKTLNDNLIKKEDFINNNQENSWFSSNNIFWCSFIIFICGCAAYFFFKNGFSFGNNDNIINEAPVKNIASAILNHIPLNLIEQYKLNLYSYLVEDKLTAYEVTFYVDNFLDYPDSPIGEHAIKCLEKILYNLNKNKHLFETGDINKGIQNLNEIIFYLKDAVIKGRS
jgi:hypothetical protein